MAKRSDIALIQDEDILRKIKLVSTFLHNVNKQDEKQKTMEIPQSLQTVKKTIHKFECIAKGQTEKTDVNDDVDESETTTTITTNTEALESTSKTVNSQPSLLTRQILGVSDYKTRKGFFEKKPQEVKKSNAATPEKMKWLPDQTAKSPKDAIITVTYAIDVKVKEVNKCRKLSGLKTVKERMACFEPNEIEQKLAIENNSIREYQAPTSAMKTGRISSDVYMKSIKMSNKRSLERTSANRVGGENKKLSPKSPERKMSKSSPVRNATKIPVNNAAKSSVTNSAKSPVRNTIKSPERNTIKSPERKTSPKDAVRNHRVFDATLSSKQRATGTTAVKTNFSVTTKNKNAPKTTTKTIKKTVVSSNKDVQIKDIFNLHDLETMLQKTVGYNRKRRIRAQIRIVKRELELKREMETTMMSRAINKITRSTSQKPECRMKTDSVEGQPPRACSPQKSQTHLPSSSLRKTLKSIEQTRLPAEHEQRSLSPVQKTPAVACQQPMSHKPRRSYDNTSARSSSTTVTTMTTSKGEVSSVKDQEPSRKLTQEHCTYQSLNNSPADAKKKGVAKVTTITTSIGGKDAYSPKIIEITEELDKSDDNKIVNKNRTSEKFKSIQKRFSQENFDLDSSRRSSRETNGGYERAEELAQSTSRSSLVQGDSIKALQHKFQQSTVLPNLKQNKSTKSGSTGKDTRQAKEKTMTIKKFSTPKKNLNEQELENICDEKQLQILLESCLDYDQKRKISARLRQIMAEQKACSNVVALASATNTTGTTAMTAVVEGNETNDDDEYSALLRPARSATMDGRSPDVLSRVRPTAAAAAEPPGHQNRRYHGNRPASPSRAGPSVQRPSVGNRAMGNPQTAASAANLYSAAVRGRSWRQTIAGRSSETAAGGPDRRRPVQQPTGQDELVRRHSRTTPGHGGSGLENVSPAFARLDDDIEKIDGTFELLFNEATNRINDDDEIARSNIF